ncbi:hypothetical protein [Pantoea sp. RSPAM1]|uniref:hypothetical protein n=1 Tax=Pantoea sp. RSPAM1 TaxID=2675223 RepID=UPI00315CDDFC
MLFGTALANANADSIMGLVKMVGWLLIYARIATFGVTRVFGLQATLADYVITFLGGSGMAGIMGGWLMMSKGCLQLLEEAHVKFRGCKVSPTRVLQKKMGLSKCTWLYLQL